MKKITIAIDGFSSTGKSSVAKLLAKKLGYIYVDSGAMYRAVTLYALQKGNISDSGLDTEALINALPEIQITYSFHPETQEAALFLNGQRVDEEIRKMPVANWVSQVAKIPEVRTKLVEIQRQLGAEKGVVMDGRDIGSVVFPDAELKIFLTASPHERARRRYAEFQKQGDSISFEEVLKNVQERDFIDTTRQDSPLIQVPDAVEVDNTFLSLDETFAHLLALAEEKINDETGNT